MPNPLMDLLRKDEPLEFAEKGREAFGKLKTILAENEESMRKKKLATRVAR